MFIRFLGGAGTVTGSKHWVSTGRTRVLVDCGLFQGLKSLRDCNWKKLPVRASELDAVVLTHAHIDHSGYLPVLVREGFKGPIFCTPPTRDLCEILLADSAKLQEEEAWYLNKKNLSRHSPALPLYTGDDARAVTSQLQVVSFDKPFDIGDLSVEYAPAGHILGAANVTLRSKKASVLFSGDVGRYGDPLMPDPVSPAGADLVVMESTYGDREHPDQDPTEVLAEAIHRVVKSRGTLLVSAFAVGRSQLMLHTIDQAFRRGLAPRIPVFLDSPMATDVTDLYQKFHSYHRLSGDECRAMCGAASFLRTQDDSKTLNGRRGPVIIISASGMLSGGRIVHHLKHLVSHPENIIALPGFQAPGTRGADLVAGARSVKIHGEMRRVKAEVVQFELFSAHADRSELLRWLGSVGSPPKGVALVHGEPHAADRLRVAIRDKFDLHTWAAQLNDFIEVDRPETWHAGSESESDPSNPSNPSNPSASP